MLLEKELQAAVTNNILAQTYKQELAKYLLAAIFI